MILIMALIVLSVITLIILTSLDRGLLNQKMMSTLQAKMIAFNGAEAGLLAQEAEINGESIDLSSLKAQIHYSILSTEINDCQQHIYKISAQGRYQSAQVHLNSAYLQVHHPMPAHCASIKQDSRRLWWAFMLG